MGRTVAGGTITVILIILFAGLLATTVGIVTVHALSGSTPSSGSGSTSLTSTTSIGSGSGSTTTTTTQPDVLASGPSQSQAPDYPISGGGQPGYGNFDAVACPSTTRCFAVGDDDAAAGVASISNSGGSSWSNLTLPAGVPKLDAISCADTNHCVAVGQGAITSTANAGSSWSLEAIPIANTTLIGAACMSSSSTCIASGITNNPFGPLQGAIVRSTDGGTTWTVASLPQGTHGITDVVCPSSSDCIAVGDSLLVSQDAGTTWTNTTVPGGIGPIRSISCPTSTNCVAIGANPEGFVNSAVSADAIATADGGTTWTSISLPNATSSLDQISCPSAAQCLAGGSSPTPGGSALLYQSGDGGVTWTALASTPSDLSAIASVSCPAVNHCAVIGRHGSGQAMTSSTSDITTWSNTIVSGDAIPPNTNAVS